MTYVICNGRIDVSTFRSFITQCHFSAETMMLMECLPQHIITNPKERQELLLFRFFDPAIAFENYTSGRIFQKDGELRWEKIGKQFRVVYVGDEGELSATVKMLFHDYCPDSAQFPELAFAKDTPYKKFYLFGKRLEKNELKMIGPAAQEGDFAEARIHRLLRYALEEENTQGPVCFIIQELYDEVTGQLALFRFVGLEEKDEEGAKR